MLPMLRLPADHPVATVFLDETGRIGQENLFGVGCLKVPSYSSVLGAISDIRRANQVFGELQWKHVGHSDYGANALEVTRQVMEACADRRNAQFCAVFDDGDSQLLVRRYGDLWAVYEELAVDALLSLIVDDEIVTVVADRYTPPRNLDFERRVRDRVNETLGRLAVAAVTRFKSSSTHGLQAVDLMLGAIAFDFRYPGEVENAKGELAAYMRELHDVGSYRPAGRDVADWFRVVRLNPPRRGSRGGSKRAR